MNIGMNIGIRGTMQYFFIGFIFRCFYYLIKLF